MLVVSAIWGVEEAQAQNLALNKPAVASSIENTTYPAARAFDANTGTRWASEYNVDPQWIYVDLGAVYNITQIKLLWEAASGRDYQLQVSNDASNWTTIRTVTGNNTSSPTTLTYDGLTGSGRYVRMIGTARNLTYGYSLWEFEVYGTPNTAPTITSNGGGTTASISIPENTTAVTTVTSSDVDAGSTRSYSISGGADAAKFSIDATSGALRFVTAPNFESPTDSDKNNTYLVTVRATDNGGSTDDQAITVSVTNVNEAPVASNITFSPSIPNTAVKKSINNLVASDPDAGNTIRFKINSLPTSGTLYINNTAITSGNLATTYGATNNQLSALTFSPAAGSTGNVTFTYTAIDNNTASSAPATYTIPVTADNPATYTYLQQGYSKYALKNSLSIATATDPNGAITNAAVTGTALPNFLTLNPTTGNITVNTNEITAGTFSNSITLTDDKGGISTVPLTLTVTNDFYQANANAFKTGENCYQLTADVTNQRGQVWATTPISLSKSFEISFNAFLGNKDAGADGIAFGFQRSSNPMFAVGAPGEGIGFGHGNSTTNPRTGGITPSVAIEFDTYQNTPTSEIAADHIAIFKNGDERLPVKTPVQMSSTSANTEDNKSHKVQVIWQAGTNTLFVYFDGVLRERYSEDFVSTVFGNDPLVYFGYTASTGGSTNQQSICEINFNPLDNDGDGVADVSDVDDDNDGISDILESNGVNPSADADDDGLPNYKDPDFGALNSKGVVASLDKDADGLINAFDLDSDHDGISDAMEQISGTMPASYNALSGRFGTITTNGSPSYTFSTLVDMDADGIPNCQDIDADGDGLLDYLEAQAKDAVLTMSGEDTNKDGIDDAFKSSTSISLIPVNSDTDRMPDYLDLDSDDDMMQDFIEAFDVNKDGKSSDDLAKLGADFTTKAQGTTAAGYYPATISSGSKVQEWLKYASDTRFNYLSKNNSFYKDTDADGLVDLLDTNDYGSGLSASNINYAFRASSTVVTLPVKLISFIAKPNGTSVQLNWATASEKDNDYFQVERSQNGMTFTAIGRVKGNGNSSIVQNYAFLDSSAPTGTSYYRLKQVDFDKKSEYSKTITAKIINVDGRLAQVAVAPNPFSQELSFSVTCSQAHTLQVELYDLNGKLVMQETIPVPAGTTVLQRELRTVAVAVGVYLLRVKGEAINEMVRVVKTN
ncbi:discoidin domain-containing protein [Rufibacter sp. XAAS-G3-1]|uniref:lectin-like domain-containing protein n=1 Tax=Rufibacter sp. XAAS-G3-1 TaxID=2729134 RepID=UPI0015E6B78E|nr:discoidin domain-containing protein [Rufibacter sp. XAAS-G3-1]